MDIAIVADLEGNYPITLPKHDVLCLPGDLLGSTDVSRLEKWFGKVTDKPILWVPGNHDVPLKGWNPSNNSRVRCLHGNTVTINGVTFGGFVWNNCATLPEMARVFAYCTPDQDKLARELLKVPACDVLVSHSPPMGILDKTFFEDNIGVPGLLEWAKNNQCRYVFCGHVHEQGGNMQIVNGITVVNAACKIMTIKIEGV